MRALSSLRRVAPARLTLASIAVLVAAGAVALAAAPRSHEQAAHRAARHLLGLVRLPSGARRVAHAPAGAGPGLAFSPSYPVVPNLVDLQAYYVVPAMTPGEVIAWVTARRPRGAAQGDSGSSEPGEVWTSFEFGAVPGVLALRELVFDAVSLRSGGTAVRVDAQSSPLPVLPGNGLGPGSLRVVESGGMLGPIGFSLRCHPAGGTVPHAAGICAAIRRNPALLYSFRGPDHSCPFDFRVSLDGSWAGRPLHSSFSICTGGQEELAGKWGALLPSQAAQSTVHVDRGIGLVRLGQDESSVLNLLRGAAAGPRWCEDCTRVFEAGFSIGYGSRGVEPAGMTVRFVAGHVAALDSNLTLTIDGNYAQRGFTSLARALRGWRVVRCGHTRELVHSSRGGSTAVVYGASYERVVVSGVAVSCPAGA